MQLWILAPRDEIVDRDNPEDLDDPWNPWYDKAFGFVVRAKTEAEARELAHSQAGDENRGEFSGTKIANTKTPWLDDKYSSCSILETTGEPGIVIKDFHAA